MSTSSCRRRSSSSSSTSALDVPAATRLRPLRDLAERIFAEQRRRGAPRRLLQPHLSRVLDPQRGAPVGRALPAHPRPAPLPDALRRGERVLPRRLRRIRRLFTGGLRRIETLLPDWAQHRVIVRCVYLFGDQLAQQGLRAGRVAPSTAACTPRGARSRATWRRPATSTTSGFMIRAREAAARGRRWPATPSPRGDPSSVRAGALSRRRPGLLAQLDAEAGVEAPTPEPRQTVASMSAARKVYSVSFGCQMNLLDAELVLGDLARRGYARTDEMAGADVILVNTCSVRDHAEDKVWSLLGRAGQVKAGPSRSPDRRPGLHGPAREGRDRQARARTWTSSSAPRTSARPCRIWRISGGAAGACPHRAAAEPRLPPGRRPRRQGAPRSRTVPG